MRKGWKKAVSTMLCAAMILSMSSFMVSAEELNKIPVDGEVVETPETPETPEEAEEVVTKAKPEEKE